MTERLFNSTAIDLGSLQQRALKVRRRVIEAIGWAGSGHAGGSLSSVDIMISLFCHVLGLQSQTIGWPYKNRFVLSKGHADAGYYAILSEVGLISLDELRTMRRAGSRLQGHPDPIWMPGLVDFAGGSLGQGLSFALGLANGLGKSHKVFALLGDGELQEGQVWEAVLAAPRMSASNLVAIIDWNGFQLSGPTPNNPDISATAAAWRALGWDTTICNGHAIAELIPAMERATERPHAIFAETIKGHGVSFMQNNNDFHGRALTPEEITLALEELA